MTRTIVIAEIGECWNGEVWRAEQLIETAADAGCDYAKFQMLDRVGIADDDPERDWFLKLAMSEEQLRRFRAKAHECGIGFLVTPEKASQVPLLAKLGCGAVKVASSCLTDDALLSQINASFRRVFVSTGLAALSEVDRAVGLLPEATELFLLHCVAEYPTGPLLEERGLRALDETDAHLSMMSILAERYPHARAGYSDHTTGLAVPLAAVAAGASVIEKHITLDRETPIRNFREGGPYLGTDHIFSLLPEELRSMVKDIRHLERVMGERTWQRSAGELKMRSFLRGRFHQPAQEPVSGGTEGGGRG